MEAIKITKKNLNGRVPLIGFAGAPWTIFSYMVEGSGSKTFSKAKAMLYSRPDLAHQLLQKITDSTIKYLKAQITAGADMVQIFDSWAGILSPNQFNEFALPYIKQICDAIYGIVPITVFAKGAFYAREELSLLNANVLGMDWNMDITETKYITKGRKVLQGNLDPCTLYASEKEIILETKNMIRQFGDCSHIANLGHGLYPDINPEKVKVFINTVKEYSTEFKSTSR